MASLHAVMNSATQGAMSLPSTISRHRRGPSTSEIFNVHTSSCPRDSARIGPNVQAGRVEIGLQELVCVHAILTPHFQFKLRRRTFWRALSSVFVRVLM